MEVIRKKREGELSLNEPYCYSIYNVKQFDAIFKMKNKEEIIRYLIDYNKKIG